MSILLIGGNGFLGSYVRNSFEIEGHKCQSAGRSSHNDFFLDLLDQDSISAVFESLRPDLVINLAGAFGNDTSNSLEVNHKGSLNLVKSITSSVSSIKLIHISSATEPRTNSADLAFESDYSRTKYLGTRAVIDASADGSVDARIIRVHNSYGIGQPMNRFVSWTINKLQQKEKVALLHPFRVRDFCLVEEAAKGICELVKGMNSWPNDKVEEVGTGQGISLMDAALEICTIVGATEDLIVTSVGEKYDAHPSDVASLLPTSSGKCETNFEKGIAKVLRGN